MGLHLVGVQSDQDEVDELDEENGARIPPAPKIHTLRRRMDADDEDGIAPRAGPTG